MRKPIITFILITLAWSAAAQQGFRIYLSSHLDGGIFKYDSENFSFPNSGSLSLGWNVIPTVGYQWNDKWGIDVGLGFNQERAKILGSQITFDEFRTTSIEYRISNMLVPVLLTMQRGDKRKFFFQIGGMMAVRQSIEEEFSFRSDLEQDTAYSRSSTGGAIDPAIISNLGVRIPFGESWMVQLALGGSMRWINDPNMPIVKRKIGFQVGIGIGYHFN